MTCTRYTLAPPASHRHLGYAPSELFDSSTQALSATSLCPSSTHHHASAALLGTPRRHTCLDGKMVNYVWFDPINGLWKLGDNPLHLGDPYLSGIMPEQQVYPNPTRNLGEEDPRVQLFVVKLQVKTSLVDAIVDPGSQKNLISEALVQKLGLKTVKHPKPYPLGWIQKEAGKSGKTDTDRDTDDDGETSQQGAKDSLRNLKIDFKVEIPMYDGSVNVEKLDDWIERLDTYFTLYGYSSKEKIIFATLKLSVHALSWWKSYRKHVKRNEQYSILDALVKFLVNLNGSAKKRELLSFLISSFNLNKSLSF
ncbi:hypothetical protein ACLB2K_038009 [Fragaria x ananassa]